MLCGGILFAFLSGKSAGRKKERLGGLNKKIKETKKSIKKTEKKKREIAPSKKKLRSGAFFSNRRELIFLTAS